MKKWDYFLLVILSLVISFGMGNFVPSPGYMDADYYYAGGLSLANGEGFNDQFLWNYLDDPKGIPHPSHTYWMPMASLIAAIIPAINPDSSWLFIRIPFFIIAACIAPLTASLSYSLLSRRSLALISGLLAIFSGFYLPFLLTTDTFGIYMLLGGVFFSVFHKLKDAFRPNILFVFLLGILSGLMHISRADGLLWILFSMISLLLIPQIRNQKRNLILSTAMFIMGYLVVMAPWFMRNLAIMGSILAPGGSRMLWLTNYDQIFTFQPSAVTFANWWNSGLRDILQDRLWALGLNLGNFFSVQAGIYLLPFVLVGFWELRKFQEIRLASISWLITLFVMTILFPYAGARGGFFHSGAALQTVFWVLVPVGLEGVIRWGIKFRGWKSQRAWPVFSSGMIIITFLFSGFLFLYRIPTWGDEFHRYQALSRKLTVIGMSATDMVIVSNPPGFYLASGNPSIAVPDGDEGAIFAVAERYGAKYLVLEAGSTPSGLQTLYEYPYGFSGLQYIGDVDEARIFQITP